MSRLVWYLPMILTLVAIGRAMSPEGASPSDRSSALYPEELDGPYTGGFGEQTCHTCHFDYELNREGGSLTVEGLEETYRPGESYRVKVTISGERLESGGFQLTLRDEEGRQAGRFEWEGERLMLTPLETDIEYLQHTAAGTRPSGERQVRWTFNWIAPESSLGPVILNVAANAGNRDDSPFGDWIYTKEQRIIPRKSP